MAGRKRWLIAGGVYRTCVGAVMEGGVYIAVKGFRGPAGNCPI